MFADVIRKQVPVTDEENREYVVILQKLNARSLKKAQDNRQSEISAQMRQFGGDIFKAIQSADPSKQKTVEDQKKAHYDQYDRDTILIQGIHSWTLPAEKNPDNIGRLDLETANFLWHEIVDLSDPFKPTAIAKADEAKDSGPSIDS